MLRLTSLIDGCIGRPLLRVSQRDCLVAGQAGHAYKHNITEHRQSK